VFQNLQDDAGLAAYRTQYTGTAYLCGALLAHRFAVSGSDASVLEYVQHAIVALKDMLGLRHVVMRTEDAPVPTVTKGKATPARTTRATKVPVRTTAPAKAAPPVKTVPRGRSKKVEPPPPVTPAPTRRGGKPAARVSITNGSTGSKIEVVAVRDDWKQLCGLLRELSWVRILGRILKLPQRAPHSCSDSSGTHSSGSRSSSSCGISALKCLKHPKVCRLALALTGYPHVHAEFVRSSIDLAAEYADLGLVDRSLEVLGRARVALFGEDAEDSDDLLPTALGVELLLLSSRMLAEMNESELRYVGATVSFAND